VLLTALFVYICYKSTGRNRHCWHAQLFPLKTWNVFTASSSHNELSFTFFCYNLKISSEYLMWNKKEAQERQ
jgi:hypothetical protein